MEILLIKHLHVFLVVLSLCLYIALGFSKLAGFYLGNSILYRNILLSINGCLLAIGLTLLSRYNFIFLLFHWFKIKIILGIGYLSVSSVLSLWPSLDNYFALVFFIGLICALATLLFAFAQPMV